MNANYFPAEWITLEGQFAYDTRTQNNNSAAYKGYRTLTVSSGTNFGNEQVSNLFRETYNGSLTATLRKQLTSDLSGKLQFQGLFDQDYQVNNNASGQQFIVKDIYTLSNTSTNITAGSSWQLDKDLGAFVGGSADYKGRYIVDGTFRYDGSSRFGAGNRWAPFGRISGVWRNFRRALLAFYEPDRLPHPCVAWNRRQSAAVQRAVRDVFVRDVGLLARTGR